MLHEEWYEEFEDEEHVHSDYFGPGPFRRACAFCRGTGVHPGTMSSLKHGQCPVCQGSGTLEFKGQDKDFNKCGRCDGSGRNPDSSQIQPCQTCGGRGLI